MKPETIKKYAKKIDWIVCEDFEFPRMPASQGYLLLELIKRYKIPFKQVGYHMDIVGIKTKKQTMLWKDTGIGARFLGLINHDDNSVGRPEDDTNKQHKVFETFQELSKEIKKRDYNNILGLRAKITEEEYWYFLEVLPPFKMLKNGFILSEALSDNLYYQFTENPYMCEVVALEDEDIMQCEMAR